MVAPMKDYESGFLALILTGILVMLIGLGLLLPDPRSPIDARMIELRPTQPASVLAMRLPRDTAVNAQLR